MMENRLEGANMLLQDRGVHTRYSLSGIGWHRCLCHWTFDEGLAAVTRAYQIRLSPQLTHTGNRAGHLSTVEGRKLLGPAEEPPWPLPQALAWHRREVFRQR